MSLKRGRKPGSKVKKLKDGTRVVVTGRAATALVRKEKVKKEKPRSSEGGQAQGGREAQARPGPAPQRRPQRRQAPPSASPAAAGRPASRSGVIACESPTSGMRTRAEGR